MPSSLLSSAFSAGSTVARTATMSRLGIGFGRAGERCAGSVDVVVIEQRPEPAVEPGDDRRFLGVDRLGVVAVGSRVVGGEAAALVRPIVPPFALHPPAAHVAVDEPGEQVVPADLRRAGWCPLVAVDHLLRGAEELAADECLMRRLGRPDPLRLVVPPLLRSSARRGTTCST